MIQQLIQHTRQHLATYSQLAVLLLAVSLVLVRINSKTVGFTDELLFEQAGYSMAYGQHWLIPEFDNRPWLEKPPLYFWITGLTFRLTDLVRPDLNLQNIDANLDQLGRYNYPWIRRVGTLLGIVLLVWFGVSFMRAVFKHNGLALLAGLMLLANPSVTFNLSTGSLDMLYIGLATAGLYYYWKAVTHHQTKDFWLAGSLIALGIMARSLFALTPVAVIGLTQLIYRPKLKRSDWLGLLLPVAVIVLPWHIYVATVYPQQFWDIYLGFNLFGHALEVPPGYQSSTPWFYVKKLISWNLWIYLFLAWLVIWQWKGRKNSLNPFARASRTGVWMLFWWFAIPFVVLTVSQTRHLWYGIQFMVPLVLLIAPAIYQLYQQSHTRSGQPPFLASLSEMLYLTIILTFPTVLMLKNTNVAPVDALLTARQKLPADVPLHQVELHLLPNSPMFRPHPIKTLSWDELKTAAESTSPFWLYLQQAQKDQATQQLPHLIKIKDYTVSAIYRQPKSKPSPDNPSASSAE